MNKKPLVLVILDGWGYRETREHNAIAQAQTPHWDSWWESHTHTLLRASGNVVGLPDGQMGNSEVGHMHLGAGRMVRQDLSRINHAIDTNTLVDNVTLQATFDAVNTRDGALHLMGLLSPGGVHSHEAHWHAVIALAAKAGVNKVYLHPFLDGRDTPPQSAQASIEALQDTCNRLNTGIIATLCGRFYAMDRDNRWERTNLACDMLLQRENLAPEITQANTAIAALEQTYAKGATDEFVQPCIIGDTPAITQNDSILFMNFRADRARQLCHAIQKSDVKPSRLVTLTEYEPDLTPHVVFPSQSLANTFGEYISALGLSQLRIAETEKYAHVTFFFNGGREAPFDGEQRELIPSPTVRTYDLQPEMSAPLLTEKLSSAIESQQFDVIICNYANADMVGHTGDFSATIKAVECLDMCLGQLATSLDKVGGEMLITCLLYTSPSPRDS